MAEFSHLHGHSFHSNIHGPDALASPSDIVARAKELGMESICITDHASISGIPEFVKACEKQGVKPVVGCELYACEDPAWRPSKENDGEVSEEGQGTRDYVHIVALARNWDGFSELCRLLSTASGEPNFYRRPRNAFADLYGTKNLVFSTACAGGLFRLPHDRYNPILADFKAAVGSDRLFLETQPHDDPSQHEVNKRAVIAAAEHDLRLIATQDFHYARPGDNQTHEVILAIGSKSTWSDPGRWKYPVDDLYIKTRDEMARAYLPHMRAGTLGPADVAGMFRTNDEIVAGLDFKWQNTPITLPAVSADSQGELMQICVAAMRKKGLDGDPTYLKRLVYEIRVLTEAKILDYFLILGDIIAWSRRNGIMVGPGRGSAGGSLVCYLTGITTIDPIAHGLIFERFYRPGRIDLPDIDSDFEDARREDVLNYIRGKYGDENVCGVSSYTLLKPKGALKDVARVFEIDHMEVNGVTKAIKVDDIQIDDLEAERKHADEVFADPAVQGFFAKYPVIEKHARAITLWMRGTGQHAAGVVISGVPVADRAAIMRKDGRRVACWDKWVIEDMGLMKLDILGLRTMTILSQAAENVWRARGRKVVYEDLPLDDAKTLKVFDEGNTTAVFQCESRGMRQVFKEVNVDRFSIVADVISLYRPGPMELIPRYTSAQTGKMPVAYRHPLLAEILAPTFGTLIYQEQMMEIFVRVGGFDYAHADKMRKIVGKKLGPDEFRKHEDDFLAGAAKNGVDEQAAKDIFSDMVAFAGYAFNKSHAVAYAIIAYWTAYMKAHYPAEFWAAHLSCTENEDKLALAMKDVKSEGLRIMPPTVNHSAATRFVPLDEVNIMCPLTAIKGVGEKQAGMIVGAREGRVDPNGLVSGEARQEAKALKVFDAAKCVPGPFTSAEDFDARVYARVVNKAVKEKLQRCGAMPWAVPHDDVLSVARQELLGHVLKDTITVDSGALLVLDEGAQRQLQRVMSDLARIGQETRMTQVFPAAGAKPRIMVVFPYPNFKEEGAGIMSKGDAWDKLYEMMKAELKCAPKDFYTTAVYKCRKPPVGWERWAEDYKKILAEEIAITKPPLIIALGKEAVEFFSGPGAKIGQKNGTVEVVNGRTVVYGMHPWSVCQEPAKYPEFAKIAECIRDLMV